MELAKQIKDLLIEHDCVIVPEFGGFIANYEPAHLDKNTHVVRPPSKCISFNKKLSSNDGLLLQAIQQKQNFNYAESLSFVRETLLAWNKELDNNGRIQLEGIGVIFKDSDANWRFNRDPKGSIALFSYGLQTLTLKPIVKETAKEVKLVDISEGEKPFEEPVRRSKLKYVIAAAILLPIAFYSYWIPSQTEAVDRGFVTVADFNPFSSGHPMVQSEGKYHERSNKVSLESVTPEKIEPISNELIIDDKSFVVAETTKTIVNENTNVPVKTNSGNYHVIAGCFSKIGNAENQVAAFKEAGYNSYILDVVGGLHRVCVQSLSSGVEANKVKREIRDLGKGAWVLKR